MIGATVLVKGTTLGTVTDLDGNFSLNIPTNEATLVFSYTGYETQEMLVNAVQPSVTIIMTEGAAQLSEVVVVGYGTRKRGAITGSVSSLAGGVTAAVCGGGGDTLSRPIHSPAKKAASRQPSSRRKATMTWRLVKATS